MGIFNLFIMVPQIIATLSFGWIMQHVFGSTTMRLRHRDGRGGALLGLAALLSLLIREKKSAN